MPSNEHQIDKLNSVCKVRLAPSKVHGIGVVAVRDVAKGEKLYADQVSEVYSLKYSHFDKLFPEVRELIVERWPLIVNGSAFVFPDARWIAYMNHSEKPNYDNHTDLALTDIKAGEEIFEDYTEIDGYPHPFLAK